MTIPQPYKGVVLLPPLNEDLFSSFPRHDALSLEMKIREKKEKESRAVEGMKMKMKEKATMIMEEGFEDNYHHEDDDQDVPTATGSSLPSPCLSSLLFAREDEDEDEILNASTLFTFEKPAATKTKTNNDDDGGKACCDVMMDPFFPSSFHSSLSAKLEEMIQAGMEPAHPFLNSDDNHKDGDDDGSSSSSSSSSTPSAPFTLNFQEDEDWVNRTMDLESLFLPSSCSGFSLPPATPEPVSPFLSPAVAPGGEQEDAAVSDAGVDGDDAAGTPLAISRMVSPPPARGRKRKFPTCPSPSPPPFGPDPDDGFDEDYEDYEDRTNGSGGGGRSNRKAKKESDSGGGSKKASRATTPVLTPAVLKASRIPELPKKKRKVGVVMTDEERRERNRVSALKYRLKQRVGAGATEERVEELEREKQLLEYSIMKEKQALMELRQVLSRNGIKF